MKMMHTEKVEMKKQKCGAVLTALAGLKENQTTMCLADLAVLDKRGSITGLYKSVKNIGILGIDKLERHAEEVLVSCGRKLSKQEKDALAAQGVKLLCVRECSNGGGIPIVRGESDVKCADYEPNGTRVINYIVLNKDQGARLLKDTNVEVIKEKIIEYPPQQPLPEMLALMPIGC